MSIDHCNTPEIVCPHCGYVFGDSFDLDKDQGSTECDECEKKFAYWREYSVDYTTRKIDAANSEEAR